MAEHDRYARIDYGNLIDWAARLEREWPFLDATFRDAPLRRLLDLGSGTGEHARFLAMRGFSVVGLDQSPSMLERARAEETQEVEFAEGDLRDVATAVSGDFGGAVCLGNVLPHLLEDDDLRRMARGLRERLLPGAPVVLQFLNYARIEAKNERALPLVFRPDSEDASSKLVFLRLMEMRPHGRVIFAPTMLRFSPESDPAVEIVGAERVEIRGWRRKEVELAFRTAGFGDIVAWGSFAKEPFDDNESRDVILVAR